MLTEAKLVEVIEKILQDAKPTNMVLIFYCRTFGLTRWEGKIGDRVCSDPECSTCHGFDEAMKEAHKNMQW